MPELACRCGSCHKTIKVDTKLVTLTVYDDTPEVGQVTYTCPACAHVTIRAVDQAAVGLLAHTARQVRVHPAEPHTGPPITLDERIELGLWITEQEG